MDQNIIKGQSVLTNTGDVYDGVLSVGGTVYTDKGIYLCKPTFTNTTATPTLNLNGAGAKTIVSQGGGAVSAGDFTSGTWYMLIYDLSSDKFIIFNSATVSSSLSIPVANTLFVSKSGNNSTALTGRFDLPFLTIAAAQAAASSGQTIFIYPGTYTENTLGKNGINYHFVNGAILNFGTGNAFDDAGSDLSFSVSGDGVFTGTSGRCVNTTGNSTIVLNGKSIDVTSGYIFIIKLATKLYVNVAESITTTSGGVCQPYNTSEIYINANTITSGGYVCVGLSSTTSTYIKAGSITSSGASLYDLSGRVTIYAEGFYTGSATAVTMSNTASTVTNIYGSITALSCAKAIRFTSALSGSVDFYGKINSAGYIDLAGTTATVSFHNDVTTNISAQPSISMTTGLVKVYSKILNSDADATSYGITKTAGTLILNNATIVTNGGTKCVYSAAAQDIKVYGTLSTNKVLGVNITDITGGVIQVDADIE